MKGRFRITCAAIIMAMAVTLTACGGDDGLSSHKVSVVESQLEKKYQPIAEAEAYEMDDPDNPAGQLQEAFENVMVRIVAADLAGSGVIFDSDSEWVWIATADHVLEHMDGEAAVIFCDGFEVSATEVVKAPEQDLAFVKVKRSDLAENAGSETAEDHGEDYRRVRYSKEAYDAATVGDLVIAMGSKTGIGEDAYAGMILSDYVFLEDFGVYMMVADVNVTPGMSGGGVFDATGNLIGIICGVSENGQVAAAPLIALMAMDR